MQRMKESKTVKEYADRLLSIVNRVRLLGTELSDDGIVQKVLLTVLKDLKQQDPPGEFLAVNSQTISSLVTSLPSITLAELLNALQAQKQRRLMRQIEGALQAKVQPDQSSQTRKKDW